MFLLFNRFTIHLFSYGVVIVNFDSLVIKIVLKMFFHLKIDGIFSLDKKEGSDLKMNGWTITLLFTFHHYERSHASKFEAITHNRFYVLQINCSNTEWNLWNENDRTAHTLDIPYSEMSLLTMRHKLVSELKEFHQNMLSITWQYQTQPKHSSITPKSVIFSYVKSEHIV